MRRTGALATAMACSVCLASPVQGQASVRRLSMPARALPPQFLRFDSLAVQLQSRTLWRGVGLGREGIDAALDGTLWLIDGIQDRHAITARLDGAIPFAAWDATPRTSRLEAWAGYRYRLDTEQGELDLRYAHRRLDATGGGRSMDEVSASVQHRVSMPGAETRPLLAIEVAREVGRTEVTWVQPRFSLELGLPVQNNGARSVGARLDLAAGLSDDASRRSPAPSFGFHEASVGVWLWSDMADSFAGPILLELGAIPWWSRATARPRGITFSLGAVVR